MPKESLTIKEKPNWQLELDQKVEIAEMKASLLSTGTTLIMMSVSAYWLQKQTAV